MRRKEKSTGKFFSIFVVLIMTASVLGFFIGGRDNEQTLEYNGWSFVRKGDVWISFVNNNQLVFDYFPEQVLDIEVSNEIISRFNTLEIDITNDVNVSNKEAIALSQYRIKENIELMTNTYIRQGLTAENDFNLPIITCIGATEVVPVIYFKESNETKVYLEGNCVIIEADSEIGFLKVKDRLLYGFFEIIK